MWSMAVIMTIIYSQYIQNRVTYNSIETLVYVTVRVSGAYWIIKRGSEVLIKGKLSKLIFN